MPIKKQPAKLCYVIMPFSKTKTCTEDEWTDIFESIINPAVEGAGLGYRCLRSEATTGNIIKKVVNSLYQANVVIADLTDQNPNVFYELGVRHTLKKRTIMIAQRRKDIPSDLHGYASHPYKWKTTQQKGELTKKLRRLLQHIEEDTDRSDNPVADFLHERSIRILQFQQDENSRKLRALIEEFNLIATLLRRTGEDLDEGEQASLRQAYPGLDHLIATQYVYHPLFNLRARFLRASLEILAQEPAGRERYAEMCAKVETCERDGARLLAAYEAGDPLDTIQVEPWPDLE